MNLHELVNRAKKIFNETGRFPTRSELVIAGASDYAIRMAGGYNEVKRLAGEIADPPPIPLMDTPPKILLLDIETSPIIARVWGLFDQNIALNQIVKDWHVLSWAAKWLGSPKEQVMYADTRDTLGNDSGILCQIWQLLDEADVVIGQNSIRFDEKKLNARFIMNGFPPPSSFRSIDTMRIAKRVAAFTSNKLEYTTGALCEEFVKLKHGKFPGMELWNECEKGNLEAWEEMKLYNMHDVLSLEEYFLKIWKWDKKINLNVFKDSFSNSCVCGSIAFKEHERPIFTNTGRFRRFICLECGAEYKDRNNLLSKVKRASLRELSL